MTEQEPLPPQTSIVERSVTVLLMIVLAALVPLASFFGLFFGMASDGCVGDTPCNGGQMTAGIVLSSGAPWVVWIAALVVIIVRWVRRRRTWWVPIAALVIGAALWALGGVVAVSAVG